MDDYIHISARVRELSRRAYEDDYLTHTVFLSASEQAAFLESVRRDGAAGVGGCSILAQTMNGAPYVIFGGWEEAERAVVTFLPSYMDRETFLAGEMEVPQVVSCIEVRAVNARFADELSHRDYLGALMNLGIERDRIGDILTGDAQSAQGRSYIFVLKENAELVCRELTRVKHTSVICREVAPSACDVRPAFDEIQGFVASERLDAVIAMVWHLSRGQAQELVAQEFVMVDGRTAFSGGYDVKPGSRVSVRGYGKFRYLGAEGETRKGRLRVKVQVYR